MARRGRPTKDAKPGTKAALGLRVTADVKKRLEAAAKTSGRTQSQEAEFRLERSFDRLDLLSEAMELAYGNQLAGVLMVIAEAMKDTGTHTGFMSTRTLDGAAKWMEDPFAYDEAVKAANQVLEAFRPEGELVVSSMAQIFQKEMRGESIGKGFAAGILSMIAGRDGSPRGKALADRVRPLLGKLAEVST